MSRLATMRTNVLVLEDNPGLASALAEALRAAGCDCRVVDRVETALREIDRAIPHIVVSDYHVVDGTAADLLAALGERDGERLPVVLATAAPALAEQTTAFSRQVRAILQKPVPVGDLVAAVERFADRSIRPSKAVRLVGPEERRRLLQFPFDEQPAATLGVPGAVVA